MSDFCEAHKTLDCQCVGAVNLRAENADLKAERKRLRRVIRMARERLFPRWRTTDYNDVPLKTAMNTVLGRKARGEGR